VSAEFFVVFLPVLISIDVCSWSGDKDGAFVCKTVSTGQYARNILTQQNLVILGSVIQMTVIQIANFQEN
jgi:hypothetical protein